MIIKAGNGGKSVKAICVEEKNTKFLSEKEDVSFVKDKVYDVCELKVAGDKESVAYKCESEKGVEFYFTKDKFSKHFRAL